MTTRSNSLRIALAGALLCCLAAPGAASDELRGHRNLLTPEGQVDLEPPLAFAPRQDGTVLLLTPRPYQLLHMDGRKELSSIPLRGPDFDPVAAALVDMLAVGEEVYLLDQAGGTIWVAGLDGKVTRRAGLFVAPTSLGRGGGGLVAVSDPGNQSVVSLDRDLGDPRSRKGEELAPYPTETGALPFLRTRPDERSVLLGLVPAPGEEKTPVRLAALAAPDGKVLFDSRVIGAHGDELYVLTQSGAADADMPDAALLHRVRTQGAEQGRTWTSRLPVPNNYCLDCGPTFRVGPGGRVWMYTLSQGEYRVLRLTGRTQE